MITRQEWTDLNDKVQSILAILKQFENNSLPFSEINEKRNNLSVPFFHFIKETNAKSSSWSIIQYFQYVYSIIILPFSFVLSTLLRFVNLLEFIPLLGPLLRQLILFSMIACVCSVVWDVSCTVYNVITFEYIFFYFFFFSFPLSRSFFSFTYKPNACVLISPLCLFPQLLPTYIGGTIYTVLQTSLVVSAELLGYLFTTACTCIESLFYRGGYFEDKFTQFQLIYAGI